MTISKIKFTTILASVVLISVIISFAVAKSFYLKNNFADEENNGKTGNISQQKGKRPSEMFVGEGSHLQGYDFGEPPDEGAKKIMDIYHQPIGGFVAEAEVIALINKMSAEEVMSAVESFDKIPVTYLGERTLKRLLLKLISEDFDKVDKEHKLVKL